MVDQFIKNQNQAGAGAAQKSSPLDRALSPGEPSAKPASAPKDGQTQEIIKSQRDVANVTDRGLAFNALFKTGTADAPKTTSVSRGPSSVRTRSSHREKLHHKHAVHEPGSSSAEEILEQVAIRAANTQKGTAASASNRGRTARSAGTMASAAIDGQDLEGDGAQHSLVGSNNAGETVAAGIRHGIGGIPDQHGQGTANPQISPEQALNGIALNTSTETLKLLDLVGPEAILTFREKLQQVWVTLDDKAARQLDVIARMPATMTGSTAMELLMVESPQGIHFVAFLKNKNDFEVLATFDRRALLPESPSRQLIEAGMMAYEQLDSVFKEGGQKIEQSAKALAASRGTNNIVFNEVQRLMVQEKRRRRKFRQMIDYFVDKLDELDLEGDPDEAPFVPKNFKDKDADIEQEKLENEIEEEFETADKLSRGEKNGFALETEDSDYH